MSIAMTWPATFRQKHHAGFRILTPSSHPTVEQGTHRLLKTRNAINVHQVAVYLAVEPSMVEPVLDRWVAAGTIERMRPVGYNRQDLDYFRIRKHTDDNFLWEQRLLHQHNRTRTVHDDDIQYLG